MSGVPFHLQSLAGQMLEELQIERLNVCKVRSQDGFIRVAVAQNPPWYQRLCADYVGTRRRFPRPRTIIKRKDTLRTLSQLANGDRRETLYQERLIEVLSREFDNRN